MGRRLFGCRRRLGALRNIGDVRMNMKMASCKTGEVISGRGMVGLVEQEHGVSSLGMRGVGGGRREPRLQKIVSNPNLVLAFAAPFVAGVKALPVIAAIDNKRVCVRDRYLILWC